MKIERKRNVYRILFLFCFFLLVNIKLMRNVNDAYTETENIRIAGYCSSFKMKPIFLFKRSDVCGIGAPV